MKRKILFSVLTVFIDACLAGVGLTIAKRAVSQADTPDDVIKRLEEALGDDYKKQTKTELAGTIVYADDKGNEIKYHICHTSFPPHVHLFTRIFTSRKSNLFGKIFLPVPAAYIFTFCKSRCLHFHGCFCFNINN